MKAVLRSAGLTATHVHGGRQGRLGEEPEVLSASLLPPSGWDAEAGSDEKDAVQPDVLVSFAAPKSCAGHFSGRHHFVAGRFVPDDVRRKFGLHLPKYIGTDCVASL